MFPCMLYIERQKQKKSRSLCPFIMFPLSFSAYFDIKQILWKNSKVSGPIQSFG